MIGTTKNLTALAAAMQPFQKRTLRPSPTPTSPLPSSPVPPPPKEYLTTAEVASKFGVANITVLKWPIPRFKPNKRTVLFRIKDVLDFEASRTVGGRT